ncbi:MAG: hypothetical protein H7221_10850 [Flavobacterium sp.]|nr:hypothetical protein [Flavobacterium sp.]
MKKRTSKELLNKFKMLYLLIFITIIVIFLIKKTTKRDVNHISKTESKTVKIEIINKVNHKDFFLNNKIGYFSQAKNKDEAIYISRLVAQKEEKKLRWTELRKLVVEKNPEYNINILEIECSAFVSMAMSYDMWKTIQEQKKLFPFIKYSSVIDGITCKTCKKLEGITRPVDDSFWDVYYPPNCADCRCLGEQYDEFDVKKPTDLSKKNLILPIEKFALNVGKHELKLPY